MLVLVMMVVVNRFMMMLNMFSGHRGSNTSEESVSSTKIIMLVLVMVLLVVMNRFMMMFNMFAGGVEY